MKIPAHHDGLVQLAAPQHNIRPGEKHVFIHAKDEIKATQTDVAVNQQNRMPAPRHFLRQASAHGGFAYAALPRGDNYAMLQMATPLSLLFFLEEKKQKKILIG
jgi:hypothetical protein